MPYTEISVVCAEVLPLYQIEEDAECNPDTQHDIGLRAEVYAGKSGNRDKLQDHKRDREANADYCHDLQEQRRIPVSLCRNQRAEAGEKVADRSADRAHINKPCQRITSENRTGKADQDTEQHCVLRRTESLVNSAEPFREVSVTAGSGGFGSTGGN